MIRFVLCDVDGTTADPFRDAVPPRVCKALRTAAFAGLRVGFNTGRTIGSLRPVVDAIALNDVWASCGNGAVLAHYTPSAPGGVDVVEEHTFDGKAAVSQVLDVLPGGLVAAWQDDTYVVTQPFPAGDLVAERQADLDEVLASPTSKIVMRWPDLSSEAMCEALAGLRFDGVDSVPSKRRAWFDLMPPGVSKCTGARKLASRLGVEADEVLAIGDDYNDIDFLRWAGRGVAMGGSPQAVQDAADEVTDTFENDGAAKTIESLLAGLSREADWGSAGGF